MIFFSVRPAVAADAGTIADISRSTFLETYSSENSQADMDEFMSGPFAKKKLVEEVGDNRNIFLLVLDGACPAGYAKLRDGAGEFHPGGKNAIEIARFYIFQSYHGQGAGSALMKKCLELAETTKKDFAWLAVWERNRRAIDFYSGWGFRRCGQASFRLGQDLQNDWLMGKDLLFSQ